VVIEAGGVSSQDGATIAVSANWLKATHTSHRPELDRVIGR
jgi:hypothetical protein